MHNFKELHVWQKGIELAAAIYKATETLPQSERFNLISQMQSAAVSIPSNIAEGCGRNSNPAFKQFLGIALGSSYELETQIVLCDKVGLLPSELHQPLNVRVTEVQRMLNGLINTL